MSERENDKPERDIEILKLTLLSDFRNTWFFTWTGIILAAVLGFLVMWFQYEASVDKLFSLEYYLGGAFIVASLTVIYVFAFALPYLGHLKKVNTLIQKIEHGERLGDFSDLLKGDKPRRAMEFLRILRFGFACVALSAILFGIQYIILYFQSVINGSSSTYVASTVRSLSSWVDWTTGVAIAVFFGAMMIGALILVIPWELLEKTAAMRRGKRLAGL